MTVLTVLGSLCSVMMTADEGLIGHWPFDDGAGATARDVSGKGHAAKRVGATWTKGHIGGALRFDGEDDYVSIGELGDHTTATVAFWVMPEAADSKGYHGLVSSDGWEPGVLHIPLQESVVEVYLHMGEGARGRLSGSPLRDGVWYHVAVTADVAAGEMRLYRNGLLEAVDPIAPGVKSIKLTRQVVGRESGGRYFKGQIDDVRFYDRALTDSQIRQLCPDAPRPPMDPRNIRSGLTIPDENYSDQPYVVITKDGSWLCTLTTGRGREGDLGQHVVSTISSDKGKSWSPLVDIEPADGPEASWAMPLITPSGRVYVFYDYNVENVHTYNGKRIRADTLGWYVYKYSDDNGRSWSKQRYRLPVRFTTRDRNNTFGGKYQMFWGIGKPIVCDGSAYFAFTKVCKHLVDCSEGRVFRSDNVLTEPDPAKVVWQMLPDGDVGIWSPELGDVQAEQNIVCLSDGSLYCMYRTVTGHPAHSYSRDGGHTWTKPEAATNTPGGRRFKQPRACPRIWRTKDGHFLFWYHNNGRKDWNGRNPVWVSGGVEKDGYIYWSQPEIMLYDPDSRIRISYPDLIEQDGRYWITETQKTVARVHEIDPSLLRGLWRQGQVKTVAERGLVLALEGKKAKVKACAMPKLPSPSDGGGFTIDLGLLLNEATPGQVVLDSRDTAGKGLVVRTGKNGTIRFDASDGRTTFGWDSDPGLIAPGKPHHVTITVDGGPKIITFVVDGVLCDGGTSREYGWTWLAKGLDDVTGGKELRLAPSLKGELTCVRIYDRPLRTSEAVGNYHAAAQ